MRFLAVLLAVALASCRSAPEPLRVAAAADLSRALPEIGELFAQRTGQRVTFSFGSSGLLSRQIKEGAPFALFAAASPEYARGIGCRDERVFARGALAIVPKLTLAELASRSKIAIANPEHAPYGAAARSALEKAGLLPTFAPKLVFGDNVQHALQLYRTGSVDAAIVARALVVDQPHGEVDAALYLPLTQVLVVCREQPFAQDFATFLVSAEASAVLLRHGFLPVLP